MRKVVWVVIAAIVVVFTFVIAEMASVTQVTFYEFGKVRNSQSITLGNHWKHAPENPEIVYVSVRAPEPYKKYIEGAIVKAVKNCSLKPVLTDNPPDLKGRVIVVFIPVIGSGEYSFYTDLHRKVSFWNLVLLLRWRYRLV